VIALRHAVLQRHAQLKVCWHAVLLRVWIYAQALASSGHSMTNVPTEELCWYIVVLLLAQQQRWMADLGV
jgi:hypothetical protein